MEAPVDLVAAWERLEAVIPPLGTERVAAARAAGRVLGEALCVDRDQPPFDRAAMDGFALRSALTAGATAERPVRLAVAGEALPGTPWEGEPGNAAVRIMTGAPVPDGCDTVVPVEATSGFGGREVEVRIEQPPGKHIVRRGEERRSGEIVLRPGERLRSPDLGMLAALGIVEVEVFRQPVVAVLVTGSEIVAAAATPGPSEIRDTNGALLAALAEPHASRLVRCGIVRDDPAAIRTALAAGLQHDVLLVSGGVSMGVTDLVPPTLAGLGVQIHFHRVAIQPGKPALFGTHARGAVLALPGNPVSALTGFRLFGAPMLRRMEGETAVRPVWESLPAAFTWERSHRRWLFLPGRRAAGAVQRVPYAGSGDLLAYARADGQIVLPPDRERVVSGEAVAFWPLGSGPGALP